MNEEEPKPIERFPIKVMLMDMSHACGRRGVKPHMKRLERWSNTTAPTTLKLMNMNRAFG